MRGFAGLAACLGAFAVVLGAFGAHALRGRLDDASLQVWHTAVDYQFWHALALLAISQTTGAAPRPLRASAVALSIGLVLFCGSLYALALGAPRLIGAVTPFGGIALIAGWLLLALAFLRGAKHKDP